MRGSHKPRKPRVSKDTSAQKVSAVPIGTSREPPPAFHTLVVGGEGEISSRPTGNNTSRIFFSIPSCGIKGGQPNQGKLKSTDLAIILVVDL